MVLNPELIKFSKRKRGEGASGKAAPHSPHRFHEQKTFFDVKSENLKFYRRIYVRLKFIY